MSPSGRAGRSATRPRRSRETNPPAAAVTPAVDERAQCPLPFAQADQRLARDGPEKPSPRPLDPVGATHAIPLGREKALGLLLEYGGGGVVPPRRGERPLPVGGGGAVK